MNKSNSFNQLIKHANFKKTLECLIRLHEEDSNYEKTLANLTAKIKDPSRSTVSPAEYRMLEIIFESCGFKLTDSMLWEQFRLKRSREKSQKARSSHCPLQVPRDWEVPGDWQTAGLGRN